MEAPQLLPQLFDFRLRQVLFVLHFAELFSDVFKVTKHTFQRFAHALDFAAHLVQH